MELENIVANTVYIKARAGNNRIVLNFTSYRIFRFAVDFFVVVSKINFKDFMMMMILTKRKVILYLEIFVFKILKKT